MRISWVIDVDGTRQPARQRALPHLPILPDPHRRFTQVAAAGYTGRKRGEVVRTRTTVLQAHTHQWLGTFGGAGNGDLRGELERACHLALSYATRHRLQTDQILLRLDGAYGDTAVLSDVLAMGLGLVVRSRDYALLGRPEVLAVLAHPPAMCCTHPASGMTRELYDCPSIRLLPKGPPVRLLIATHPATDDPPKVGQTRHDLVYELFVSTLPASAVIAQDVLDLYLHRGSFETVLADEDREQDPDRWCSHTPWGQEWWQILSQWVWNLRLEWGQYCAPTSLRITTFADVCEPTPTNGSADQGDPPEEEPMPAHQSVVGHDLPSRGDVVYGPPQWAQPSFTRGFPGSAFLPQPDGTLLCPAGKVLTLASRRQERAGSVRVDYIAQLNDCRVCPVREQCQNRRARSPRRVSAVYWPLPQEESPPVPPPLACLPVRWRDWPRCSIRRQWMKTVRSQTVEIARGTAGSPDPSQDLPPRVWTRSQRAHWRLPWQERLARNARPASAPPITITLSGLPAAFAQKYGFALRKTS